MSLPQAFSCFISLSKSHCQRLNQLQVKKRNKTKTNVKPEVSLNQKDFLKHETM